MCREVSSSQAPVRAPQDDARSPSSAVVRSSYSDRLQDVNALLKTVYIYSWGIWVRPMPSLSR